MKKIKLPDTTLTVFDDGDGEPVLFVHGFPLDHSMWIEQLATFALDRRVIAPDLRGFGANEPASGTLTMEQLADDCAGLLDALSIDRPITLVGLSMGGYVAWQFLRKYPARLGKLVLCDTRAASDNAAGVETRLKMAEHVVAHGMQTVADAMPAKLFAKVTFESKPQLVEGVKRTILRAAPSSVAAAQRGMAARPDVSGQLPSVRVPTLIIVGEEDAISPPDEMRAIAAGIPHAQLLVVPQAGHMSPLENPAVVNRALREFLAG